MKNCRIAEIDLPRYGGARGGGARLELGRMAANACCAGVCPAKREIFKTRNVLKIETLAGCRESPPGLFRQPGRADDIRPCRIFRSFNRIKSAVDKSAAAFYNIPQSDDGEGRERRPPESRRAVRAGGGTSQVLWLPSRTFDKVGRPVRPR